MDYDLVVVGGSLAGPSLDIALARHGARVLIVEREAAFKDRVRGEGMLPWGAEARTLAIYQPLIDGCARDVRWWTTPQGRRDLHVTSPSGLGCLNFYHPEIQHHIHALDHAIRQTLGRRGGVVTRPHWAEITRLSLKRHPDVGESMKAGAASLLKRYCRGRGTSHDQHGSVT